MGGPRRKTTRARGRAAATSRRKGARGRTDTQAEDRVAPFPIAFGSLSGARPAAALGRRHGGPGRGVRGDEKASPLSSLLVGGELAGPEKMGRCGRANVNPALGPAACQRRRGEGASGWGKGRERAREEKRASSSLLFSARKAAVLEPPAILIQAPQRPSACRCRRYWTYQQPFLGPGRCLRLLAPSQRPRPRRCGPRLC